MSIFPVLLDARPSYLEAGDESSSVLRLPMGRGTLLGALVAQLRTISASRPLVVPTFAPGVRYADAIRATCPDVDVLSGEVALRARIAELEPSDALLLIDPTCYPVGGPSLRPLTMPSGDTLPITRHLLSLEVSADRTKEFVQADPSGQVRRIQRYYEPVTWPFASGVVWTYLPVASTFTAPASLPLTRLPELRRALTEAGVPSRDLPSRTRAFDLTDIDGLLAFNEHAIFELVTAAEGKRSTNGQELHGQYHGRGCAVHHSARLIGPVVLLDGVTVEEHATIIGPTVVGAHARIGAGALVAQCLVMPGTSVRAGATTRHTVVTDASAAGGAPAARASRHDSGRHRAYPISAPQEPSRSSYQTVKRAVDATAAAVSLLLLSPLLLTIALLVKVGSRGPVLYGGQREGKDGKPFKCWKFRSMSVGADAKQRELAAQNHVDGPQFKMDDDPRVTRLGRILRRTNIDELPQLINVLKGEMSLVGPRPSPFRENQVCVPWRHGRLSVRPGMTGLWQVCRHDRAQGDFHQWIQYDLLYVRHASLLVDLKILLATVLTLGGRWPVALGRIIPSERTAHDAVPQAAQGVEGSPSTPSRSSRELVRDGSIASLALLLGVVLPATLAGQGAATSEGRSGMWMLGASAQHEWSSNARFTSPDDPGDQVLRINAMLGRDWQGRRGRLAVALAGGGVQFAKQSNMNQATYRAAVDLERQASRRLAWQLGYATQASQARELALGATDGLLPPQVLSHMHVGRGGVDYRLSALTTTRIEARYDRVTFDSPLLDDGWTATARWSLMRTLAAGAGLGVNYDFVRSSGTAREGAVHTLRASLEAPVGRIGSLRMSAGAARVQQLGTGEASMQPVGEVEVRARVWRTALSTRYERQAGQAFGVGQILVTDYVGGMLDRPLTSALGVVLRGGYSVSREPGVGTGQFTYEDYHAGLRYTVARHLTATGGVFLRRRDQGTRITSRGAMLSLASGVRFR